MDAVALAKICSYGEIPDCIVDGPFALDNAISAKSAQIKKVKSPVAGSADILIAPDLEAGNILGKALIYYGGKDLAHAVVGAKVPILTSSRSDPYWPPSPWVFCCHRRRDSRHDAFNGENGA